jgi:tripartite-type tricarboxylate transporter receptor subunit TctC
MHDHVPYQGSAPALAELLGAQTDSVPDPITTNVDQLKVGSPRRCRRSSPARGLPQFALMPAAFTTRPHFSMSAAM